MSDYTAIADASETLVKLIADNISSISEAEITLSSPDEMKEGQKLSVFLYQITEDIHEKNQMLQAAGSDRLKRPPITLNLFYIITPNSKELKENHMLIGRIIQLFYDSSILRGPVLRGSLAGEELKLLLSPVSFDDINKIWTVLLKTKPYKLSVCYTVTPVRIDSTHDQGTTRVKEKVLESYLIRGKSLDK